MNRSIIAELWNSLVQIRAYFQWGIAEQTRQKSSFGEEDAKPIKLAYQRFLATKPYLTSELSLAVESALLDAQDKFNELLSVFRDAALLAPGDSVQRAECYRKAHATLELALRTYNTRLVEVECLLDNKHTILFLAADPTDAARLRFGEEFREISQQLALAKSRGQYSLAVPALSLRPRDIAAALLTSQPQIVHFTGHGTSSGALCFEDETGRWQDIRPDALSALFDEFAETVKCVVLNACYSDEQAKAIAKHINYVIGMNAPIKDKAAIAFSAGFYHALGAGCKIEKAYKLGCVQIGLENLPGQLTPVLFKNPRA